MDRERYGEIKRQRDTQREREKERQSNRERERGGRYRLVLYQPMEYCKRKHCVFFVVVIIEFLDTDNQFSIGNIIKH